MTDEGKSGPAKYCREGSGGFDGDGGGLLLSIFEGTGGAAEDNAAVVYGGKSGESGRWEDGPGGNEKPTFVDAERVMSAAVKMLMVSAATRSAMRPSTKRLVSSMKADTPPVVEQPPAWSWIGRARES